jgi:hypothetical protein
MDRRNRLLWIFIAVLLTAVGALGIAAGRGYLHGVDPHTTLLPRWWLDQWHAWGVWALLVLTVAGLVMAWLGWRLLRAELRPRGHRRAPAEIVLEAEHGDAPGETRLSGHALSHAAERALRQHPAVEQARVGLSGDIKNPQMHARINTTPDADLQAVGEHVSRTLQQLTVTCGLQFRPVHITVRPSGGAEPRVR